MKALMLTIVTPDESIPILVFQLPVDILLHTPGLSASPMKWNSNDFNPL